MRPKCIVLKHKAEIALMGWNRHASLSIDHRASADFDPTYAAFFQSCDRTQQCCLAAATRPQQHQHLALLDFQRNAVEGHHLLFAAVILAQMINF